MKDMIDQFMWGFQRHFRIGIRRRIEQALSTIGLPIDVRVVLVGFATEDHLPHPICVEPEGGPLSHDHLTAVSARAAELYQADPESQMFHTNARHHGLRQRGIFHKCRANAIIEANRSIGRIQGFHYLRQWSVSDRRLRSAYLRRDFKRRIRCLAGVR